MVSDKGPSSSLTVLKFFVFSYCIWVTYRSTAAAEVLLSSKKPPRALSRRIFLEGLHIAVVHGVMYAFQGAPQLPKVMVSVQLSLLVKLKTPLNGKVVCIWHRVS